MSEFAESKGVFLLGFVLLIPFILLGTGTLEIAPFIAASVFAIYACLLIINFEAGFLTLIFIRSSIDYLKNFTGGGVANNLAGAISIALIILGVFYVLYSKVNILKFEESGPFLIFLALCGLSIIYSPNVKESVSDWLRLVSVFSVYILSRIIFVTKNQLKLLFMVILLSALIPILLGYYQLFTGHGTVFDAGQNRIVGTFIHPNAFASYLLILLIFCTAQFLEGTFFVPRTFLILFSIPTLVIFIFTFSRGAWIVFVFAMMLMGVLRYRKLLTFFPVIIVLSVLLIPAVRYRIVNIFEPGYTHGRSGWEWRLDTWSMIGATLSKKPLLGNGLASIQSEFGILTHNDFLRLLAEVGILGFLSYVYFSLVLLHQSWKDFKSVHANVAKSFQVGLLAMISGFLIRQFADNTLRNTVMMIYFWIFLAISRNIAQIYTHKGPQEKGSPYE